MSLLGLLVGISSQFFPYTYLYFPSLDRVGAVSLDPRTSFLHAKAIAIQSLPWIVDSMTYGLFIFSLILSPILRSQLLFLNLKQNNKILKIKSSNMTKRI
ncbi:Hypothetical protein SRAE_X000065500 [Strongyloides ratti]|uniref:Uncharacterized protein n=1 Tax=Strongyloides ratti TaxID=34506 RepID=A0A090N0V1_STRRB|nr:Hypothetical protein SRAE_X000065500 [Strongyloides ratti]CEF71328.1 Hypothetical protein SRAE_X000065500 [Strongyloides ratti]